MPLKPETSLLNDLRMTQANGGRSEKTVIDHKGVMMVDTGRDQEKDGKTGVGRKRRKIKEETRAARGKGSAEDTKMGRRVGFEIGETGTGVAVETDIEHEKVSHLKVEKLCLKATYMRTGQ